MPKFSLRPTTLRDQVVDHLRVAMMSGDLPPGARLNERELCEDLGISRTLLRESMRSLESQGLVVSTPHKGVTVATVSRSEAIDHYATRGALEGLMIREFVQRASTADVLQLRAVVDEIARTNSSFELSTYVRLKREFYEVIMKGANNTVAAGLLRIIHARIAQLWAVSLSQNGRAEQSVAEISMIVDAIQARNEDKAFVACMAHNASALKNTLQAIDSMKA